MSDRNHLRRTVPGRDLIARRQQLRTGAARELRSDLDGTLDPARGFRRSQRSRRSPCGCADAADPASNPFTGARPSGK